MSWFLNRLWQNLEEVYTLLVINIFHTRVKRWTLVNMATDNWQKGQNNLGHIQDLDKNTTTEYCAKLQEWMWQYYSGYLNWQTWVATSSPFTVGFSPYSGSQINWPAGLPFTDGRNWSNNPFTFAIPPSSAVSPTTVGAAQTGQMTRAFTPVSTDRPVQHQNGNVQQAGREYTIASPLHRFFAETVDFFILFCIKATIVLGVMHLSGMKDISKFALNFIVEEIDEETSMEELQKMMAVALVYRVLVCFYESICIWGAGGATPGKFLLGLRVVTCDTSVLVRPNRVRVVPASNVTLSASTVRALNKNFSIAFFFPAFITLLFFQHNRTVYDIVAGTIVVRRGGAR